MLPRANCIPKPARLYRTVILGEWNQRHAGVASNLNKFRFMRRQNHTSVACKLGRRGLQKSPTRLVRCFTEKDA